MNVALTVTATFSMTSISASAMPVAISPYSITAAPDSSAISRFRTDIAQLPKKCPAHARGTGSRRCRARDAPAGERARRCLLEAVLHRAEVGLEVGADALDHRDDRDRDAGSDQAVLDGGRAGLVAKKTLEHGYSS